MKRQVSGNEPGIGTGHGYFWELSMRRQAVNGLLDAAGSDAQRCSLTDLYVPPEFEALKAADLARYRAGFPHALDILEPAVP